MKKEEKLNQFWKYVLLIVGGILILVPLLVTVFSSFKTTKDIMNHFFSLPNPFTLSNYERLISDGIGGYFWNSAVITVLSLIVVAFFIPAAASVSYTHLEQGRKSGLVIRWFRMEGPSLNG